MASKSSERTRAGLVFLFHAGGFLPDLDPYFRWIGGPEA